MKKIIKNLSQIYGLDERAIFLFRFFLGLVLLSDIFQRILTVDVFFSDVGILPRWIQAKSYTEFWRFNIYYLSGNKYYLSALLLLNAYMVWLFMTAKKNIKLITFVLWIFVNSLHMRNYLILQSGDTVLRLVLFWFLFFPKIKMSNQDCFSEKTKSKFFNMGVFGYYVQIAIIYFYAGYAKSYESYFSNGDAVYLAMELERYSTDFGQWLMRFPEFLKFGSRLTYGLEMLCPVILFFPFKNWIFRLVLIIGLFSFHIGTILMMEVGHFPHASMVLWLPLIPSQVLDLIFKSKKYEFKKFTLNKRICFFERTLLSGLFLRDSSIAINKTVEMKNEYFINEKKCSQEVFWKEVLCYSSFSFFYNNRFFLFGLRFVINFIDLLFEIITLNKELILKSLRLSSSALCLFFILFTFFYNLNNYELYNFRLKRLVENIQKNYFLRFGVNLDQRWGMFSPSPTGLDGWHIIYGERNNGDKVDLWGTDFTNPYKKPESIADTYKNFRWRKFLGTIMGKKHKHYRKHLWRSVCLEVNNRTEDPMRKIKTVYHRFVSEKTTETGVAPLKYLDYGSSKCPSR